MTNDQDLDQKADRENTADPVAVKRRGRKAKLAEEQARNDLLFLLGNPAGRRFLWAELARCRVFRTSFHTDHMAFAHNEGRRSAGVELMCRIIEADAQAWILMQQEAAAANV